MAVADLAGRPAVRPAASISQLTRRGTQLRRQQFLAAADHHFLCRRHNLQHIAAFAGREAESLALADREPLDAVVLGQHLAGGIDDVPGRRRSGRRWRISAAWSPSGTKQISTLSGLSATPRPASRARARTSSLR